MFSTLSTVFSLLLSYGLLLALFAMFKRRRGLGPDDRKPFIAVPANQTTSNQLYLSAHAESPDHVMIDDDEESDG